LGCVHSKRGQIIFQFELQFDVHGSQLIGQVAQNEGEGNFAALSGLAHPAEDSLCDSEATGLLVFFELVGDVCA